MQPTAQAVGSDENDSASPGGAKESAPTLPPSEISDLRRYKVRHFAMPGNLGSKSMAKLLVAAKNDIRACCRDNDPPISATVLRNGGVQLLIDAKGKLHERGEEKTYHKGRVATRVPYKS
jgi:hypothetical protein